MANPLNLPENPEDGICIACLSNPHKEDCDIGQAWTMIEDAKAIIENLVPKSPYVYRSVEIWLEKYNEVT